MAAILRGIMLPHMLLLLLVMHLEVEDTQGIFSHFTATKYGSQSSASSGASFAIPAIASSNTSIFNVLDYGAVGDGKTDCSAAFQKALDVAGTAGGGIVYVPAGSYLISSKVPISIPKAVSLVGTYRTVPSHTSGHNHKDQPNVGSVLRPSGGRGSEEGCFLQMTEDTTLQGFTIYYPDQVPDKVPVPYPWTVCMQGNNVAVTDVECLNCWNAIYAVQAGRHYIARVQGQPINTGVYVDQIYDIGRIEDVHFNPWFSSNTSYMSWQLTHGRSFVFARTDWEYVFNTFSYGYALGYHFIQTKSGACNGNFLGIGADMAVNASVQIDASQPEGILITNGEFTSFGSEASDPTQIVVSSTNTGAVSIVNSAFWGPSNRIARLSGSGVTTFSSCVFSKWDAQKKGLSAILVDKATGGLIVNGNQFLMDGGQVDLGTTLKKAVIIGNVITGPTRITGKAVNTQIGLNADDSPH